MLRKDEVRTVCASGWLVLRSNTYIYRLPTYLMSRATPALMNSHLTSAKVGMMRN